MRIRINLLFLMLSCYILGFSQNIDQDWKKGIVLFEVQNNSTNFVAIGTGFIIKYGESTYVVTNKHIALKSNLFLRLNLKVNVEETYRFSIDEMLNDVGVTWIISSDKDIAAIPLYIQAKYVNLVDIKKFSTSVMKGWEYLNEGDELLIMGFPLKIGTDLHYSPLIRFGIVSLKHSSGEFIIDANMFPGNSGGPIFLKSSIYDYRSNTLGQLTPHFLVGLISSYIPYTDVAISQQTNRPRITFEENSGLSLAYSINEVLEMIDNYLINK